MCGGVRRENICPGSFYLFQAAWLRWLSVSMDDDVAENKPAGRVCVLILPGKVLLALCRAKHALQRSPKVLWYHHETSLE